jgi:prefoldin subunit 5
MGPPPYGAPYSREEEIRMLRDQAGMIRDELAAIDARIQELEKEKSQGGDS